MKNWNKIETNEDFYNVVEKSKTYPQIIFKDSTHCGISAFAKERLINGIELIEEKSDFNYLDLLNFRSISNLIATELGVVHQSPQVIVLKNGEPVHVVTHHSIKPADIAKHL